MRVLFVGVWVARRLAAPMLASDLRSELTTWIP